VAARVRELLAQSPDGPAARIGDDVPSGSRSTTWLPDAEPARSVPRHGGPQTPHARWRWDPGRRGAAALGVLLIVVIAVTGWWLAAGRPHEVPISGPSEVPAAGEPSLPSETGTVPTPAAVPVTPTVPASSVASSIVVDVTGRVRRPGLYTLAPGARVDDAVNAAGGARHSDDLVSLNLAQPVTDGEQIVVTRSGSPAAPVAPVAPVAPGSAPAGSASAAPVDLNSASLDELETLPGIGPVLGQHILDYRSAHGQFTSIDQLRDVSGIGDVRFAQLSPLVTL
jgi:competence protein ComEA